MPDYPVPCGPRLTVVIRISIKSTARESFGRSQQIESRGDFHDRQKRVRFNEVLS
jgi:hypothetical protein